jgi:hypothetical protein
LGPSALDRCATFGQQLLHRGVNRVGHEWGTIQDVRANRHAKS